MCSLLPTRSEVPVVVCWLLQVQAAYILDIPIVATEQYPKGLGNTVAEIDVSKASVFPKTKFSMVIPEVEKLLSENQDRMSVVLMGIEVDSGYMGCWGGGAAFELLLDL